MLGTSASGQGWMAGPYMSARLTRNLFFDARAAWGRSDNRVDPLGIYTDSFSTDRSLVSGKLTGNWSFGALQFRPSAEVIYFHETQKAYVNQINIAIPEQSISLGRFTFGPEVAYRMRAPNGGIVEPFIGVKGVWDFAKTADTTVAGTVIGNNAFPASWKAAPPTRLLRVYRYERRCHMMELVGSTSNPTREGPLWQFP